VEAQKDSLAHEVFKQVTIFRRHYEEFAKKHPHLMKVGGWALRGIGYLCVAGVVKAGVKLGGKKMLALFGSQVLSQEVIAAVIEHGTESLVDHAISYASSEQEAAEFAETAVWAVEAALAGATVIGVAGLIKDKAAVSSKLQATKVNVSSSAKAKFTQKQQLREKSSQRISAIAKGKIATGESPKVSSFKEIREIPPDGPASQFSSKIFHKEVEWTAPTGTKQTYKVVQRNDIDWNLIRKNPDGPKDFIGKTNKEAARHGYAPEMLDGSVIKLHHIQQQSNGPLAEVSSTSHGSALHKTFGYKQSNPELPVDRNLFKVEKKSYWKARIQGVENGPNK
jgi:hypothetical protein